MSNWEFLTAELTRQLDLAYEQLAARRAAAGALSTPACRSPERGHYPTGAIAAAVAAVLHGLWRAGRRELMGGRR